MRFSVIVVCLNAGERLKETIDSVINQTYTDYEVIIKDGGSKDGSVEKLISSFEDERGNNIVRVCAPGQKTDYVQKTIKVYKEKDTSIYDAMNQAIRYANGEYYIFLNSGDTFYDETVLEQVAKYIKKDSTTLDIVYGDLYHKALKSIVSSAPEINDFTCYRNVPCHQTCLYSRKMFEDRGYDPTYNVRADYEHFLWCYYEKKAVIKHIPVTVCTYEGGGYSETTENKKRSAIQHREIVVRYMGKKKANHYRRIMRITLQPLRTKMAESETFSGFYNRIKQLAYKIKNK